MSRSGRDRTIAILLVCLPSETWAAVRTVQFAGMIGAESQTAVGPNTNSWAYCQLSILNLGSTSETLNQVYFVEYNQAQHQLNSISPFPPTATGTNADLAVYRDSTTGGSATCGSLASGSGTAVLAKAPSMCFFKSATQPLAMDGSYALCAGVISVQDTTAAQPGSVIAAGSITLFQEAQLLGGSLSGALYLSGTHVYMSTPTPPNLAQFNGETVSGAATNMNFYCAAACASYDNHYGVTPLTGSTCDTICGSAWTNAVNGEWSGVGTSLGWLMTDNNLESGGAPALGSGSGSWAGIGSGGWSTSSPFTLTSPGNYPAFGFNPSGTPTAALRMANPHFDGGLVMEIEAGPLASICSGNAAFWNNGGAEFTHVDGVDTHAVIYGNPTFASNSPPAPPERLLCSHRHSQDDLFLSVGSTSSFSINGGMPF
jgi:hypothetical protein